MKGQPRTPVLRHAAAAPAKKIIYTKPSTLTRNPGPALNQKQRMVPGLGLGMGT
jgi:hypothetical protein